MIELGLNYAGIWAALTDKPYRQRTVVTVARKVLREILSEFARRTGRESLDFRFTDASWGELNLSARSLTYMKYQRSVFGRPRPYFSPRRKAAHLQYIIRTPGSGHRVRARNLGEAAIGAVLTLPAARRLNGGKGMRGVYRREFLNLTRPGQGGYDDASRRWLRAQFGERFPLALADALRARPRKKTGAAAA